MMPVLWNENTADKMTGISCEVKDTQNQKKYLKN